MGPWSKEKGNDAQLRAYVPIIPGLEIQAGQLLKMMTKIQTTSQLL